MFYRYLSLSSFILLSCLSLSAGDSPKTPRRTGRRVVVVSPHVSAAIKREKSQSSYSWETRGAILQWFAEHGGTEMQLFILTTETYDYLLSADNNFLDLYQQYVLDIKVLNEYGQSATVVAARGRALEQLRALIVQIEGAARKAMSEKACLLPGEKDADSVNSERKGCCCFV